MPLRMRHSSFVQPSSRETLMEEGSNYTDSPLICGFPQSDRTEPPTTDGVWSSARVGEIGERGGMLGHWQEGPPGAARPRNQLPGRSGERSRSGGGL